MPYARAADGPEFAGRELWVRVFSDALVTFMRADPRTGTWGDDCCEALVNPTTFKESMGATYSLRPVLGLSHEVVQYVKTTSRKLSMELWLSLHVYRLRGWTDATPAKLLAWRNWFESLLVPGGLGLAPPMVTVLWPGANLNFSGVVETLEVEYERFAVSGAPIEMKLNLGMVEVVNRFMPSNTVKARGIGVNELAYAPVPKGPGPSEAEQMDRLLGPGWDSPERPPSRRPFIVDR